MAQIDRHFEVIFDRFCQETSSIVTSNYFKIWRLEFELLRMLQPEFFSRTYDRVLKLGCGIGFKALLVTQIAKSIDAIDMVAPYHGFQSSKRAIDIGRNTMVKIGVDNVNFFAADYVEFMTKNAESYDLIYSDYLLEHVPNLPALCQAMFGCLRHG